MSFTTDMWTDDFKQRSYTTLTGHWIENWVLCNRVLITEEFDATLPKTGINVKEQLMNIFQGFGLEDLFKNAIFTTDKGTNIISALEEVERVDCINHVLNRVLQQCLQENIAPKGVNDLLRSVKSLVCYVKKSSIQNLL